MRLSALAVSALTAVGLTGLALSAPGVHAQSKGEQCFYQQNIESFAPSNDEKKIYLKVIGGRVYRLDLDDQCPGLAFRERIVLRQVGSGTICSPLDLDLHLSDHGIRIACPIAGLHLLTPEELAAVPKKERP
jgi:hypothetical protein